MSRFRELTTSKSALDFAAFARHVCVGGLDLQDVSLARGDLAVAGAPISTAPEQEVTTAQSIAVERFRAVDWLQGGDLASAAGDTPPTY